MKDREDDSDIALGPAAVVANVGATRRAAPGKGSRTSKRYGASAGAVQRDVVQRQQAEPRGQSKTSQANAAQQGGLPSGLRAGVEELSGMGLRDVQVEYNSTKPAAINAHAYTQGSNIHIAPGQEQHLAHEAWHVVQQKQGRVSATTQAKGIALNDDSALEKEADEQGARAEELGAGHENAGASSINTSATAGTSVVQRVAYKAADIDIDTLDDASTREHISRFFRLKANKGKDDDADYSYQSTDLGKLKARLKAVRKAASALAHAEIVAALDDQIAALATSDAFVTAPVWDGKGATGELGSEVFKAGTMAADETTVVAAWKAFLGNAPYSHKHPRTGLADDTRLVSGDGKRTIRYGNHEKTSKPTLHHYHEETWTYDSNANHIKVANQVQRVPVK